MVRQEINLDIGQDVEIIINGELALTIKNKKDSYWIDTERFVNNKKQYIYDIGSGQKHVSISKQYTLHLDEVIEKNFGRLSNERLSDLLCNALEGGSNYWCAITEHNRKEIKVESVSDVPFKEGGYIFIEDIEEDHSTPIKIDLDRVKKGEELFLREHPSHYLDAIKEEDDATTADVFLQCVVLGDLIYG